MSQARLPRKGPSTELISAHKVNHRAAHVAGRAPGIFAKVRSHRDAGQWPTREECASAAHSKPLSRTTCHGAASAAAIPAIGSPPARHLAVQQALLQLSWRRPPCSTKRVAQSSLPRVLMVQPPFPVDSPPPCTIQVQQIVTNLISTGGAPQAQCERCGG